MNRVALIASVITTAELVVALVAFTAAYIVSWALLSWRPSRLVHGVNLALAALAFLGIIWVATYTQVG